MNTLENVSKQHSLREATKKVIFFSGPASRAIFWEDFFRASKKDLFFLVARRLPFPLPLLVAGPLKKYFSLRLPLLSIFVAIFFCMTACFLNFSVSSFVNYSTPKVHFVLVSGKKQYKFSRHIR